MCVCLCVYVCVCVCVCICVCAVSMCLCHSILLSAKTANPSLTEVFDCCHLQSLYVTVCVCVCVCVGSCVCADDMFMFYLFGTVYCRMSHTYKK